MCLNTWSTAAGALWRGCGIFVIWSSAGGSGLLGAGFAGGSGSLGAGFAGFPDDSQSFI